jgi:4-hydroxy-tetrahydrodipicolinate synthase
MSKHIPGEIAGVFGALPTPFAPNGDPAWDAFDAVLEFALDHGLKGICLGGATSEYPACSVEHRMEMFERVARRLNGRARMICAIGAEHMGQVRQLARAAADNGAIGLLFPPPMFLPYVQEDLVAIMGEVSASLPLPVLIYYIPQCTRELGIENVLRLIHTVPNIVGFKDSSGRRSNLAEIKQSLAEGPMAFMIGSDDLLLEAFDCGAVGSISGIAPACPELILPLYEALQAGQKEQASALQARLDEFIARIQDFPSPWATKLTLQVRGVDIGALAWPTLPHLAEKIRAFQHWLAGQIPAYEAPAVPAP